MATYVRPDLAGIDPAELSDYLLSLGIHCRTLLSQEGLVIETDVDAESALASFVPTSTMDWATLKSTYVPPLPAYIADHVQHLRDFRAAVRDGVAVTNAQRDHVIADLIDALRYVNARITDD